MGWLNHSTRYLRSSRRHYLTGRGVSVVSELDDGARVDEYPLSRAWRRSIIQPRGRAGVHISLRRLSRGRNGHGARPGSSPACTGRGDAIVELPNRVSLLMQSNEQPHETWDAIVELPNRVSLGVLRQGVTLSRSALGDRFWRMSSAEGGPPPLTLVLASDEVERAEAARKLERHPDLPASRPLSSTRLTPRGAISPNTGGGRSGDVASSFDEDEDVTRAAPSSFLPAQRGRCWTWFTTGRSLTRPLQVRHGRGGFAPHHDGDAAD